MFYFCFVFLSHLTICDMFVILVLHYYTYTKGKSYIVSLFIVLQKSLYLLQVVGQILLYKIQTIVCTENIYNIIYTYIYRNSNIYSDINKFIALYLLIKTGKKSFILFKIRHKLLLEFSYGKLISFSAFYFHFYFVVVGVYF